MYSEYNKHDVAVYAGYLSEDDEILKSASGGIATALSGFMLQQGGYVVGVAYSDDFYKAEYVVIDNISDIHKLRGSKYIDCDKNNIYSEVKQLLDAGQKVLFFGLPCVVGALYSFLGERPENLLTCELICHGPTYAKVHSDYIAFLEKKYKSKVIDFSVRYKAGAWTPGYLYAKFDNGQVFQESFYHTQYGMAFSILGKKACYHCNFKGNNRQADIMIGDFWGATQDDPFWNKYGVSVIFAETEKGDAAIKATPGITLFDADFDRAVQKNPMVIKSKQQSRHRDHFEQLLSKKGLIYAANHCFGWKGVLKNAVKRVLPSGMKKKMKALVKKALSKH